MLELDIPNALAPTPIAKNSLLYFGAEVCANDNIVEQINNMVIFTLSIGANRDEN